MFNTLSSGLLKEGGSLKSLRLPHTLTEGSSFSRLHTVHCGQGWVLKEACGVTTLGAQQTNTN